MEQSDHDLLIRISEQIAQFRLSLETYRIEWNTRATRYEAELAEVKKDVESLRISRATIYGMSAALTCIITGILKVFWK
jgi:hypothetical protein